MFLLCRSVYAHVALQILKLSVLVLISDKGAKIK
jgi:hypothetical protein